MYTTAGDMNLSSMKAEDLSPTLKFEGECMTRGLITLKPSRRNPAN